MTYSTVKNPDMLTIKAAPPKSPRMSWQVTLVEIKWTLGALAGLGLTVPSWVLNGQLPEATGALGLVVVLFSVYKMWEQLKMKKELHREKIRLIRELREGKLKMDEESKGLLKLLLEGD